RAIALVRAAVEMDLWRLEGGATLRVTGAPVLVEDLTDALTGPLVRLLAVARVVMALVLLLVFRSRARLLPLAVGLAAVAGAAGVMALAGVPLTMASIAVLPVLLGLAIDYAIQYQARVEEAERTLGTAAAVRRAARTAAPPIALAAAATIAGFLALLGSPVPMVRSFGALLVGGIVLALAFALTAGTAALAVPWRARAGRGGTRAAGPVARSLRGAGELLGAPAAALAPLARRAARPVLDLVLRRP